VKTLVTGATGELGSNLVAELLRAGHDVVPLTRSALAAPLTEPMDDIRAVLHLAGKKYDARAPAEAFVSANVEATGRLLSLLERRASAVTPHLVFFSTMFVYGERSEAPLTEDFPPSPRSQYGRSKREAERLVTDVCARKGIPFTILRLATVYGTGGNDVFQRLSVAYRHVFPFVLGDGDQRRSFLAMDNLSTVVLSALGNPRWYGVTINVADPQVYRMIDVARHLAGNRRVRHIPARWARGVCALRPVLGAVVPGYRTMCDHLERLGESFSLDTARLRSMHVGPLPCLPIGRG